MGFNDVEIDLLISHLAGPLAPDARRAFRAAAEGALATIACPGPGTIYRAVAPLQRGFFDPPDDHRAAWDISGDLSSRASKLRAAPGIGYGRRTDGVRFKPAR